MSEKCIGNKNLRYKLRTNNLIERIDHKVNVMNRVFMGRLPSTDEAQSIVIDGINNGGILLIRFGLFEYQLCYQYLEKIVGMRTEYTEEIVWHIHNDAGIIWQTPKDLDDYAGFIMENLKLADVIAYWRNYPSGFVFKDFMKKEVRHIFVEDLYPYPFWHEKQMPFWQNILIGKKVLVVTAFADTVCRQYKNRESLWENVEMILPKFELITFQAVCTQGGWEDERFATWKEAVSYMSSEIIKIECDIVLVSCGGYGIPLAVDLRKRGKCVIQWGGCYQLWFGIKGARWDNAAEIKKYFNDYWVYPTRVETPPCHGQVDNSSYWKRD